MDVTFPATATTVAAGEVAAHTLIRVRPDSYTSEVLSRTLLADGWVTIEFVGGSSIDLLPGDLVEVRG